MKIGDDVLTAGLVIGGAVVAYSLYKSFQGINRVGAYGAGKIDDAQNYITVGVDRVTGSPKWVWGQARKYAEKKLLDRRDTSQDANRTLLGKDEGSWVWGYGPKKGFTKGAFGGILGN
tara:strand:+ start:508 stop:861 length:354 start_codon:yes stop_codon:yes gene_type:complete